MALTALDICNAALVKLGSDIITTFGDGSNECAVANTYYEITRDALLGGHPWSFAVIRRHLQSFDVPMDCSHDFGFRLPDDFLKILAAHGTKPVQILGRKAYSDAENVVIEYVRRVPEEELPSSFVSALVIRLAAEFCMPLIQNAARSDLLFKLADAELRFAKLVDSQQDDPKAESMTGLFGGA